MLVPIPEDLKKYFKLAPDIDEYCTLIEGSPIELPVRLKLIGANDICQEDGLNATMRQLISCFRFRHLQEKVTQRNNDLELILDSIIAQLKVCSTQGGHSDISLDLAEEIVDWRYKLISSDALSVHIASREVLGCLRRHCEDHPTGCCYGCMSSDWYCPIDAQWKSSTLIAYVKGFRYIV